MKYSETTFKKLSETLSAGTCMVWAGKIYLNFSARETYT